MVTPFIYFYFLSSLFCTFPCKWIFYQNDVHSCMQMNFSPQFCSFFPANEPLTTILFILLCKWTSHNNSVHFQGKQTSHDNYVHSSMQMNLSQQFCSLFHANEPLMTILFILLCKWTSYNNSVQFFSTQVNFSLQICSNVHVDKSLIILFTFLCQWTSYNNSVQIFACNWTSHDNSVHFSMSMNLSPKTTQDHFSWILGTVFHGVLLHATKLFIPVTLTSRSDASMPWRSRLNQVWR